MAQTVISFKGKLARFSDLWSPKVIAQMNDYHFKLARLLGDFVWHSHPETDEAFIVIEGQMAIEFQDGTVELEAGEMVVVPKGVAHRPRAPRECAVLLVEPAGTVNTGDAGGDLTAPAEAWI